MEVENMVKFGVQKCTMAHVMVLGRMVMVCRVCVHCVVE